MILFSRICPTKFYLDLCLRSCTSSLAFLSGKTPRRRVGYVEKGRVCVGLVYMGGRLTTRWLPSGRGRVLDCSCWRNGSIQRPFFACFIFSRFSFCLLHLFFCLSLCFLDSCWACVFFKAMMFTISSPRRRRHDLGVVYSNRASHGLLFPLSVPMLRREG